MAKRPLKPPSVPKGSRHNFFTYMQELVVENGDLSTPRLGKLLDYSHQAVYKALTGPRMPSRAMATNLAKVLGGESAAAVALQLWSAGVREERGLADVSADELAPTEPLGAPTALDLARVMLNGNGNMLDNELVRRRWTLPALPGYRARSALAAEIRRLTSEVGAVAEWFTAETTRKNLSDWMCGRAIPPLHNLMNFGYELRLEHEAWLGILGLHAAAVAEAQSEASRNVGYLG